MSNVERSYKTSRRIRKGYEVGKPLHVKSRSLRYRTKVLTDEGVNLLSIWENGSGKEIRIIL